MTQDELARRLRVLRAERGLSLTKAAERTGVTRDTLSEIERGKRHPYVPTLTKIAAGYGVSVEGLLEGPALAGKAEAPSSPGPSRTEGSADITEEALTAKIVEIQGQYRARRDGINLLCERWESRLSSLGENLDRETLDEMSIVGTYITGFFVEAAADETVEIWSVLNPIRADKRAPVSNEAIATAARISIMRPVLKRWERLGNEIYRRGAEKFGEDAARNAIDIGEVAGEVDELTRHRLKKRAA